MKTRKRDRHTIEEEVYETLQCLDRVEKVKAKPFFYTRLRQRLDAIEVARMDSAPHGALAKILRPALVAASILLGVLVGYDRSSHYRSQSLDSFAEVYGLQAPDLNDYFLPSGE
jgi:hypothetical protein